jgi:K(+)-stimulated pyrophosphate-energized sodium pump
MKKQSLIMSLFVCLLAMMFLPAFAGEASLEVPNIKAASLDSYNLLLIGLAVSVAGVIFGLVEFFKVKKVDVHAAMAEVGNTIFETCKTYLIQQGKFLLVLEILIGFCKK